MSLNMNIHGIQGSHAQAGEHKDVCRHFSLGLLEIDLGFDKTWRSVEFFAVNAIPD